MTHYDLLALQTDVLEHCKRIDEYVNMINKTLVEIQKYQARMTKWFASAAVREEATRNREED